MYGYTIGIILWLGFIIVNIAAWFTHVIICIQNEQWFFLIAGAIFFPIALVHGWGSWFGFF